MMPGKRSFFSNLSRFTLSTILLAVTSYCVYLGYVTSKRRSELFTPVPTAAYSPEIKAYQFTDSDFVYPLDVRPASVRRQEYESAIQGEIERLKKRGEEQAAERMKAELQAILNHDLASHYPPPDGAVRLHAVSIYEGHRNKNGHAKVEITDTSGPVVLVLSSSQAVRWEVTVGAGAAVQRVFVGRRKESSVVGLPAGVPVDFRPQRTANWTSAKRALKELTGLDLVTRQEAYRFEGIPFEIGPGNVDWSNQMRAEMLAPLYRKATRDAVHTLAGQLASITFPILHVSSVDRFSRRQTSFATASIFGPYRKTMQPMQTDIYQFAFLPGGPSFFSVRGGRIVSIDPETGTLTDIEGIDEEEIEHDPKIALDHEKNRLYLWGRELKSIELLTKKVTSHRQGDCDVRGFTYSATAQCLYGVCAPYDGNSHSLISQLKSFNLRGADIATVDLSIPIPSSNRREPVGVVEVGDKLLVMPQMTHDQNGNVELMTDNYVVDPRSGEVLFVVKRAPR